MHSAPVTAIIPCYQCAATLGRAITSVARQSAVPSQVILVDDASEDFSESISVCENFDLNFTILRLGMNAGPSAARNAGWNAATEPFIAFLDADDTWHPEKTERQLQWMIKHPKVALTGSSYRLESSPLLPLLPMTSEPVPRRTLLSGNPFFTSSVMLHHDLPFRFDETMRRCEDYHLWMRIGLSGYMMFRFAPGLATRFKEPYGHSGLSADLDAMQAGEIEAYRRASALGLLTALELHACVTWSYFKFLRRKLLHLWRRCGAKRA